MNTISTYTAPQPEQNEFQFYPTPAGVVRALISPYSGHQRRVLEPSAGRGDIADALARMVQAHGGYNRDGSSTAPQIQVCEISVDLRAILLGKGHKVIGTDFLSLEAPYSYELIVMNPPFAACAEHVVKAWELLDDGGSLAAIMPRAALVKLTGAYGRFNQVVDLFGKVEELGQAFAKGDRRTLVDCVIVRLEKPKRAKFEPFANFHPAEDSDYTAPEDRELPAPRDLIRAIVDQYNAAMRALKTYHAAKRTIYALVPEPSHTLGDDKTGYNEQIDLVKGAFWQLIFTRTRIGEVTTSGYRKEFEEQRSRLAHMEFSEATIYEVLHRFMVDKDAILGACVMDVFNTITSYSMDNIERDKQWHTNKLHMITAKVIVPDMHGDMSKDRYASWSLSWRRQDFLNDIDKVLTMFGGKNGLCTRAAIEAMFSEIADGRQDYDTKFETPNFYVRVFKKGTAHLWFRDLEALGMINRYAAERSLFVLPSGK